MTGRTTSDLSVGEMAARAGVAVSTLHYYEAEGLIQGWRTAANHRRYDRRELRRVAIIRIAQTLGIPLAEVREVLDRLPRDRPVRAADWAQASAAWAARLDERIELMQRLRGTLDYCVGCGCLSLENCPLYNPDDKLGRNGPGARRWTGSAKERADAP
ncbi:MAG: redox-sensitive transcriptional activator SoxR [Rhodobacter sp.]|nr:redox-sensitive transcriptional activator SoxR [Rhodobacter sp.]